MRTLQCKILAMKTEKTDKKLLIIGPNPFIPQPTAQNWFSILWNIGTRHLFTYLWFQGHRRFLKIGGDKSKWWAYNLPSDWNRIKGFLPKNIFIFYWYFASEHLLVYFLFYIFTSRSPYIPAPLWFVHN